MIEIYGKDFCPYCDKAVALCEQKGVEFTYKKLGRDFNESLNILNNVFFQRIRNDSSDCDLAQCIR